MRKLIWLEWRKNHIAKYIRSAAIVALLLCLFILALCFLGIANDPETGMPDAAPGNSTVSAPIELFSSMSFLVFTSVMLDSYIVSAYQNKTMSLMFSYVITTEDANFSPPCTTRCPTAPISSKLLTTPVSGFVRASITN